MNGKKELLSYVRLAADWWTPPSRTQARVDRVYNLIASEERESVIRDIIGYCPDHGDQPTSRMACHCEIADELRRAR